jgi:hypothetical protein
MIILIRYLQFDILAKQPVPVPVQVAVRLAAIPPHAASGTLLQSSHVLVRCAGVTRRVVAALRIFTGGLDTFLGLRVFFLSRIFEGYGEMA